MINLFSCEHQRFRLAQSRRGQETLVGKDEHEWTRERNAR